MNRYLLRSLMAGSMALGVFAASADDVELFDDRYYLAPMGSLTGNRGNSAYNDGLGGAFAVGKAVMPHLGVEILGDYLRYGGKTTTTPTTGLLCGILTQCPNLVGRVPSQSLYGGGLGVNYYLSPDNGGLFLHANAEAGKRFMYNAGLGFDQPFLDHAVYLRLEALYHKEPGAGAEPLFHLGFRIPFGSLHEPEQPAPPPPVAVVPVEQPAPAPEAAPEPEPAPAPCQLPAPGQPISFEGCKAGDTIVLHGVNFEFNKAKLTVNAKTLLDQVADALLARKDIKVEIDGHTDGKGSVAYNQKLSEARSASVMKYLAGRGIEQSRMASKGFGKSMPIADNSTDEGRELNRRVELKVTESGAPSAAAASAPESGTASPAGDVPEAAPPGVESAPAAQAAPTGAPVKKRGARRRRKAAPAGTGPAAAAPESAPVPAPQDAGVAASPVPAQAAAPATPPAESSPSNEPAAGPAPEPAPHEAAATPASAASGPASPSPPAEGQAQTEPASAPPEAASQPLQEAPPATDSATSESAHPASAPASAPDAGSSAAGQAQTEPAPAPPEAAPK